MKSANNGQHFLKNYCSQDDEAERKNVNEYLWLFVISFERYARDDKFSVLFSLVAYFSPFA